MERHPFSPARVLRALMGPRKEPAPDPIAAALQAIIPSIPTSRRQRRQAGGHPTAHERRFERRMDVPRGKP